MRREVIAFAVLVAALVLGGLGYVAWASTRVDAEIAEREARATEIVTAFESAQQVEQPEPVEAVGTGVLAPGEVLFIHRGPVD